MQGTLHRSTHTSQALSLVLPSLLRNTWCSQIIMRLPCRTYSSALTICFILCFNSIRHLFTEELDAHSNIFAKDPWEICKSVGSTTKSHNRKYPLSTS